jgi:hypothetical protein
MRALGFHLRSEFEVELEIRDCECLKVKNAKEGE